MRTNKNLSCAAAGARHCHLPTPHPTPSPTWHAGQSSGMHAALRPAGGAAGGLAARWSARAHARPRPRPRTRTCKGPRRRHAAAGQETRGGVLPVVACSRAAAVTGWQRCHGASNLVSQPARACVRTCPLAGCAAGGHRWPAHTARSLQRRWPTARHKVCVSAGSPQVAHVS